MGRPMQKRLRRSPSSKTFGAIGKHFFRHGRKGIPLWTPKVFTTENFGEPAIPSCSPRMNLGDCLFRRRACTALPWRDAVPGGRPVPSRRRHGPCPEWRRNPEWMERAGKGRAGPAREKSGRQESPPAGRTGNGSVREPNRPMLKKPPILCQTVRSGGLADCGIRLRKPHPAMLGTGIRNRLSWFDSGPSR